MICISVFEVMWFSFVKIHLQLFQQKPIKQEPEEFADFVTDKIPDPSRESQPSFSKEENEFGEAPSVDLKNESPLTQPQSDVPASSTNDFEDQVIFNNG